MSVSIGEQIVVQMVAALNAPGDKPCTAIRGQVDPVAIGQLPGIFLYSQKEAQTLESNATGRRIRTVRVLLIAEGVSPADSLIDPLYQFVVTTLRAAASSDDNALGVLLKQIYDTSILWETEASYEDRCVAAVDFDVHFITELDDPSAKGSQA
ncbi:hypothetical protein Acid345_3169 [Candidatus Koribacter versatilis Ellin345]|uniref:Uncharacterized protein n=1 Tax=Koribacter versatilis (strain Ellin345) TaxID=204669 RepID=Q1ILT0_KORVE|nr:hypothetical protein [Candidatus Koribacter versatilis]ABF42170.1 hypothetical protein Acid345_3169 [Candidatus Koribacter versatilis Ellin345]